MTKNSLQLILLLLFSVWASKGIAQTIVPVGNVSGTWTAANSPYQVQGLIIVQDGQTLTIEPGVTVEFVSSGRMRVKGNLVASGTAVDSIRFTPISTNLGWKGIQIDTVNVASDSSIFEYCIMEHTNDASLLFVNNFDKVRVEFSKFQFGDAYYDGGAINTSGDMVIQNNLFQYNYAGSGGGAIHAFSVNLTVENNVFLNNSAGGDGGAINTGASGDGVITGNTFSGNTAYVGGALSFPSFSDPTVSNNTFMGNSSWGYGGGVVVGSSSDPVFSNNIFTGNSNSGNGGVYYFFSNSDPVFIGNYYEGNSASSGGVAYIRGNTNIQISNETFINNSGSGGAIYMWENSYAKIDNCVFSNNGGGAKGGAFFISSNISADITNCTFTNNTSHWGGAIVSNGGAAPHFKNCTISNNEAVSHGGAVHSYSGGTPMFTNCIFHGNTTGGLGATYYNQTGTPSLSTPSFVHCNVEGGQSEIVLNGSSLAVWTNNIDSNPQFIAPSAGSGTAFDGVNANWSLTSNSPCFNAGTPDTTGLFLPATDLGGATRVVLDTIDMGAYEVQLGLNAYGVAGDTNLCQGDTLVISAVVSGVNPVTYQWQLNGTDIVGATDITLSIEGIPANAGDYRCIVSNGYGSDTTTVSTITYHAVGSLTTLGADVSLCSGDSILLEADNGYASYSWNDGLSSNDSLTTLTTNSYYYSVVDSNSCVLKSDTISVTFNSLPVFDLGADIGTCDSTTIWLNPMLSNVTYDWNNGFSTNDSLDVTVSGTYFLEATDTNNCSYKDTIDVTFFPFPNVNLIGDTLCEGQPYSLDAGSGFVSYDWNNGQESTASISADTTGTYFVQVVDGNGCVGNDTTEMLFHPNPSVDVGPDQEICSGDSLELIVTQQFSSYNWNNGFETDSSVFVNTSGQWYVVVADSNACAASDTMYLTVNALPSINLGTPIGICLGDSVELNAPGGYVSYDWNNGLSSEDSIIVNTAGIWFVAVVDSNGCSNADSVMTSILTASSGVDVISVCEAHTWIDGNIYTSSNNSAQWTLTNAQGCDSIVTLDLTILNSTTGTDIITACDSYTWIDGNTYTSTNNTAQWTFTNAQGCDSIVTLNLTINSATANVTSNDPELIADPGASSYQWLDCQNGYAAIPGATSNSFILTTNGEYAVVIEENGCLDTSDCFVINNVGLTAIENQNWKLYPNPTNNNITLKFLDTPLNAMVEVTNPLGQIISKQEITTSEIELNLGRESGIYFVRIVSESREEVVPVVKW